MDINNLIDRGGLLYAPNDNKPYTGNVFSFYKNGIEELNGRFRNGLKNGKWKWWNEDGGIDITGSYKNGLMNGNWTYYHANGQVHGQGRFINGDGGNPSESSGIPFNGRRGSWTFWHENGQKSSEGTYKNVKLDIIVKDVVYLGVSGEPVAISLSKAKQLFDEGVVFVDARGDEYFADGHIQNAWNSGFFIELMFKLDSLQSRDDGAVLYCSDDDCGSSEELAYDLYNEGFTKLFVFQGGWLEWNAAGYPVE